MLYQRALIVSRTSNPRQQQTSTSPNIGQFKAIFSIPGTWYIIINPRFKLMPVAGTKFCTVTLDVKGVGSSPSWFVTHSPLPTYVYIPVFCFTFLFAFLYLIKAGRNIVIFFILITISADTEHGSDSRPKQACLTLGCFRRPKQYKKRMRSILDFRFRVLYVASVEDY